MSPKRKTQIERALRSSVGIKTLVRLAKFESIRFKGIADEAEEAGVLPQVEEQVESVTRYIEAKKREAES